MHKSVILDSDDAVYLDSAAEFLSACKIDYNQRPDAFDQIKL